MKEVEEPFGKNQIGSSAMAYKRNPMRSERVCSLARYLIGLPESCAHTHANQWFERTLDDSAIRRMVLPESCLAADVILTTAINIADGLHVWPAVIKARLNLELPFMATEVILMDCVKAGGDRQELHEAIREHSMAAGRRVKEEGAQNDLLERISKDSLFSSVHAKLDTLVDATQFVGRAPQQVTEFIAEVVDPILTTNELVEIKDAVNV
jgi:adenylosuccinate lyase